jgi:alpha-beta hydrolase superfamily lysophospholipase
MAEQRTIDAVVFAADLPDGRMPSREVLGLTDGYSTGIYVHSPPEGACGLPVLYVHGIQSHPGWFAASAAAMAAKGHAVFQVTRRGSGDNARLRGHAESASQLLQDLQTACGHVLARSGAERLHLVGVSWGGKLAACYAAQAGGSGQLASLTLVAPGIVPRVDLSAARKLAVAACLLVAPRRPFGIPLNDVELFTDNERMRRYLRTDRHRLLRVTARFLYASRRLDTVLRRAPGGAIAVPATLILARRDRIIDNERTQAEVQRLTGGRAVVEALDGCHTLEFEPDPGAFHASLIMAIARGEAR